MMLFGFTIAAVFMLAGALLYRAYRDRRDAPDPAYMLLPRRVRRLRGNLTRPTLPFVADGDADEHSHERGDGV